MAYLFGGILLLYLTLEVDITLFGSTVSVDLFSNIVGYILFYLGLKKLQSESKHFAQLQRNIIPLIVISVLVYVLAFLGLEVLSGLLAIAEIILAFYATRQIIWGVGDMEAHYRRDMRAARLKQLWKRYLVLKIIVTAAGIPAGLISVLGCSWELLIVMVIAIATAAICLLITVIQTFITFSFAKKQYDAIKAGEEPRQEDLSYNTPQPPKQ